MTRMLAEVALITGGAAGLGKAIAARLVREGATVVITDIDAEEGGRTADELGAHFMQHDVCNERQWTEVLEEVQRRYRSVTVLVNNAGILGSQEGATPENTSLEAWRKIFSVNVEGVFLGCKAVIPVMRRGGRGSIINMSSVAGLLAAPYATAYGASKAAVRQLTKSVAQHCAQEKLNVRCNSVHPGNVVTPLWRTMADAAARARGLSVEQFMEMEKSFCPMNDFTLPEDVAGAVAFLASTDSRFVTGEALIVDGGLVNCDTYSRFQLRSEMTRAMKDNVTS